LPDPLGPTSPKVSPAATSSEISCKISTLPAGYGLRTDDGFVPQMQAWLDAQGADVVLINAGVSGDTTAGGLSRTDWTLTPDVDAMLLALGGNDYLRGLDPALSRANLDAILAKAETKTLKGITSAWVADQKVTVKDGKIDEYRVVLKITFVLED